MPKAVWKAVEIKAGKVGVVETEKRGSKGKKEKRRNRRRGRNKKRGRQYK